MPNYPESDSLDETQNETVEAVESTLLDAISAGLAPVDAPIKATITPAGSFCIVSTHVESDVSEASKLIYSLINYNCLLNESIQYMPVPDFIKILEEIDDNVFLCSPDIRKILDKKRTKELFTPSMIEKSTGYQTNISNVDPNDQEVALIVEKLKKLGLTLCIEKTKDQKLGDFVRIFPELCAKYDVPLLSNKNEYATRTAIGEPPDVIYTFNVSPENMHSILMHESTYYTGYHYNGSVLRLNEPNKLILKENALCLFPVIDLGTDNKIILRNAGCNITDTIATQLSFFVKKYADPSLSTSDCYGHRDTPVLRNILQGGHSGLLDIALSCAGITQRINIEVQEGVTELTLTDESRKNLMDMTPEAHAIYSTLASVPPDELNQLQSMEIPITTFLTVLANNLAKRIKYQNSTLETFTHKPLETLRTERDQRVIKLTNAVSTIHTMIRNINTPHEEQQNSARPDRSALFKELKKKLQSFSREEIKEDNDSDNHPKTI